MAAAATPVPTAPCAPAQDPSCALPSSDYQLPEETPVYSASHLRVRQDRARRLKASARTRQRNNAKPARRASLAPSALGATLQPSPTQAVHRIFFAVALGLKYHTYAYLDTGCDRSCISRSALKALIAKGAQVVERPCGVQLVGWFGSKSQATSEIVVSIKISRQEETASFLVVDELDYDLVIGNDIFISLFGAGISPGQRHSIVLKDKSKVPYCTSVDPVRPDPDRRVPVLIAEHQVLPAHSMSHVRVFLPPFAQNDPVFLHNLGVIDPDEKLIGQRAFFPPHLVRPLRLMRLIVFNGSSKRVKLCAGDTCGHYQAIPQGDIVTGKEVNTLSLRARAEVRRMYRLQAKEAKAKAKSEALAASTTATTTTTTATASDGPPPGTLKDDVRGKLDPGTEGVAYDDRMELPFNTPQSEPDIDPAFPGHLRQRFVDTIMRNLPVSDSSIAPTLSHAEPMRIELTKDVTISITRHLPLDRARVVDDIAQDYYRQGATQLSTSAFNAPVVLAKKPDGTWRFCVDYRELNAVTKRDAYQFPHMPDIFESLAGSKYFSTIDLAAGFHQIPLHPDDRHYTAFSTLSGHWEFTRVPYGLTNSPPWMQRAISHALRGLEWSICVVWIDDIIIHSKTAEQHIEDLHAVMHALQVSGFSVRLRKCHFGMTKIKYLGHIISADGIAKSPDNIKDIAEAQPPKTVKELQRVLGLFNYYRRFVHQFAALARPLTRFLRGNPKASTPIHLDQNDMRSFATLRAELIKPDVILAYPDFSKEFIIETDASQHHIGAILSQRDDKNVERPIAFWSQTLTERQSHWSAYKRELFALLSACKEWRRYLQVRQVFTARFDQRSLLWILKATKDEPMLAGWVMQLQEYGIDLQYQPGEKHQHVDALTKGPINRNPYRHGGESTVAEPPVPGALPMRQDFHGANLRRLQLYPQHVNAFAYQREDRPAFLPTDVRQRLQAGLHLLHVADKFNLKDLARAQRDDAECKPYIDYLENQQLPAGLDETKLRTFLGHAELLEIRGEDGVLYHTSSRGPVLGTRSQRVAPLQMRPILMRAYHDDPTAGHFSFDKAFPSLANDWWWPGMLTQFRKHCKSCHVCGARNRPRDLTDTTGLPGQLVNFPPLDRPMQRVAMDILGPFVEVDGYHYVLVITDHFSRFVWTHKLKTQSAREIAAHYLKTFQSLAILPSIILTDRGSGFDKALARAIAEAWAIDKRATSAYHPQCNGMPERFNQTLAAMLAKLLGNRQEDWTSLLHPLSFAYNSAHHPSIGMAPVTALYGLAPTSPLVATLGRETTEPGYASPSLAQDERAARLKEIWQFVQQFDRRTKERQKKAYDAKHDVDTKYALGDKVWLWTPHIGRARKVKGYARKLASRWAGPYTIVEAHSNGVNYRLRNRHGKVMKQLVHIQRLKRYLQQPMPIGVPTIFDLQDPFDAALDPEFDLRYNSDRDEPDPSEPETTFSLADFGPPTSVDSADPPSDQIDLFEPRLEELPVRHYAPQLRPRRLLHHLLSSLPRLPPLLRTRHPTPGASPRT